MKKHLTKFLAMLLALVSAFVLTSCNGELDGTLDQIANEISNELSEYVSDEFDFDGDEADKTDEKTDNADADETTVSEESNVSEDNTSSEETTADQEPAIDENGTYTSKEDVALYIYTYGKLPSNFITKNEAKALGWSGGSLEEYAPGMCIGGDRFGNYEGILPQADGRTYTECDIDTLGASKRGAKRIVFSNDGLIYYTEDHYETFELLYGEE